MEDSGIGEAVSHVVQLAKDSLRTELLEVQKERHGIYYIVGPSGLAQRVLAEPNWHGETLDTPGELAQFINEHGKGDKQAVFVGTEKVVYVYNLNDRRDVAVCPLRISPQYAWLCSQQAQMTQVDFIRLLRIQFRGCLASDNILPLLRELKFDSENNATGQIQHGRESLGKSVVNAVTGLDRMPEETALNIQVFENHPLKAQIKCAIEIFPSERTFRLTPYPLEVKVAMDEALGSIEQVFAETKATIHRGKP